MRTVVIGYGMAGARVVSELRARVPAGTLTVLGAEPHRAYNRILLSNLVGGKVRESDLAMMEPASGVDVRLGTEAVAVDRAAGVVSTSDDQRIPYDRLVLATGSRALLPPIKGLVRDDGTLPDRVAPFRTLDDCRRIVSLAGNARRALVLGGGLLGLEAARGLAARGLAVTVLHAVGHLMERQLDPAASEVLVSTLDTLGIAVELGVTTVAVDSHPDRVEAVLGDGRRLRADLFVVACGVRPETGLAERAGLVVERGIVVNDRLRTSDPHIYAIGDCAQHAGALTGLVAPAWAQARVAAEVLSGAAPLRRYRPAAPVTRLKAAGIDLAAMGESTGDDGERVTFADPARGSYVKLLVRGDRLAGAIMLGDNPTVGSVIQMFDRGAPVPADRRALLLGRALGEAALPHADSPALMPDAAVICQCNTVSKGALVAAWRAGAQSLPQIAAATRATTGCGSCREAVCGLAEWLSNVDTSPNDEEAAA
jgi:assimilatory nitrate reductase electron transfer subunit